jgi:hypothetical protein
MRTALWFPMSGAMEIFRLWRLQRRQVREAWSFDVGDRTWQSFKTCCMDWV